MIADPKVQGILCLRVAIYWLFCQVTIFGVLFALAFLEGSAGGVIKRMIVPAMIASLVVLPVALFDMVVFSNRFVGPVYNFRKKLSKFAGNGVIEELRFRPGDYYPDLQENFNRVFCEQLIHQDGSADDQVSDRHVPQVTN